MSEESGNAKVQNAIERAARLVLAEYREELTAQQIKLIAYDIATRALGELKLR